MKICRFKINGQEKIGVVKEGRVFEATGDIFGEVVPTVISHEIDDVEFMCPTNPRTVFAIGLNYDDHASEMGMEVLDKPLVFFKAVSSILPHNQPIVKPKNANEISFEAELAIVVKKECKNVPQDKVNDYILGYSVVNDVTARDVQRHDGQWARSKSFDTFCPYGPVIETEFLTDTAIIRSHLNGEMVQNGNISDMVFSPEEIFSYVSKQFTLFPGDVIATGTPDGVGTMQPGDVVTVEVERIGSLKNSFVLGDEK